MNITFDKALLWLLPYLYLVSIAYYWGFWGTFDIDAFNYYQVSDIVKGVTGPIGSILFFLVFAFGLIFLNRGIHKLLDEATKSINGWKRILTIAVIDVLFFALGYAFYSYLVYPFTFRHASTNEEGKLHVLVYIPYAIAFFVSDIALKSRGITNKFLITILLVLPIRAFLGGKETALLVRENKEFDYVVADSLLAAPRIYKYLGKAGDHHFLLTLDNLQRIVVPTDKLAPLVLENFSLADSASIVRFEKFQKQLTSVAPPPRQLLQPK